MKKVSITGGKGGTGKSTVAVNLASIFSEYEETVLADLDVEGPVDHILLGIRLANESPVEIMLPFIDYSKCTSCGVCGKVCDTGAIVLSKEGKPFVFPRLCSGCRSCYFACPVKAISEGRRVLGYTYRTDLKYKKLTLVTGSLIEGEEHTSPVVLSARLRAEKTAKNLLLVDTSAGTGNTVSIALEGSDLVLAVTEPTPLGVHDLRMILELTNSMGLDTWVILNRAGIGPEDEVQKVVEEYGARLAARIPYSKEIVKSYVNRKPVVDLFPSSDISKIFRKLADEVKEVI
ncbi:MAG: cobalamin biosynthesis protein CobQ [Thermoprotei archaeon]|nr:MAG: cobalamin biosynthesis protein CobQ [Thermoprotei archaeon]